MVANARFLLLSSLRQKERLEEKADRPSEPSLGIIWLNDDDDNGNPSIPDYATGVVNGQGNLRDFFPVAMMIQNLLQSLPPGQYSYFLKQADAGLAFTYTNLTSSNAFAYKTSQTLTGYGSGLGQPAASASVTQITAAGVQLDLGFLQQVTTMGGVILVEANANAINGNGSPLVFEVRDAGGKVITSISLALFFSDLRILNGQTADFDGTIPTTLIQAPENPNYATEIDNNGGFPGLGALPIGQGRTIIPNQVYLMQTLAAAKVSLPIAGLQYRWQRFLARRSWYIQKSADGESWTVTQKTASGNAVPGGLPDMGHTPNLFSNNVPSSVKREFYFQDTPGIAYGGGPHDIDPAYMVIGNFIHEEKVYTYIVQTSYDGINWVNGATLSLNQAITVKYIAANGQYGKFPGGGNAATDWQGSISMTSGNLPPVITISKVQAFVGGSLPVNIDSNANN
jgi:hypothetical protein